MTPDRSFPDEEFACALSTRLLDKDPLASVDFCEAYLQPLKSWIDGTYPGADPHFRLEAVHNALMTFLRDPSAWKPERGTLAAYLRMSARGDLANRQGQERRHQRLRIVKSPVELDELPGNPLRTPDEHAEEWALLDRHRDLLPEADQRFWDRMRAGEKRTSAFAALLGIADRSKDEQKRAVKRVRDRIVLRLKRGVRRRA